MHQRSCWCALWYDQAMAGTAARKAVRAQAATRKITLEVPADLLARAQRATGGGVTETVRDGLKLLAAHDASQRLLQMSGKVHLGMTWQQLKGKE